MEFPQMAEGRYLYCIIECDRRKSFGEIGIGGRSDVYTIPYKDISAVVSDTPLRSYEPTEDNALTHMNVIRGIMQEHTVLPLRFGTVFKGDEGIRRALVRLYRESKAEIKKLEGKIELGAKVLWPPDKAREDVRRSSARIRASEEEMKGKGPGIVYLLKVRLEEEIKDELNRRSEEISSSIFEELSKLSLEAQRTRLISHMILNAAFLLERASEEGFRASVDALSQRYSAIGLEIICSGPWPPFNFVNIHYE